MIILVLLSPLVIIILIEVVSVLLSAGADTELYTATGCCGTALHLATAMADLRLVQALLTRGADVSAISEEGSSVLHYLAVSQTPEALDVVKVLFETGSEKLDINAVDWDGYTALMRSSLLTVIRKFIN